MRLFVAVDLPEDLADPLSDLQRRFEDAAGFRFPDPEQAHFTLKFLGETDPDRVPEIEAAVERALAEADVDPFRTTVGGLGVFPSLDYISVVWTGATEGGQELTRLHESIERETTALGFDPESHEFTPHVTLARMDDARGKELVQQVVEETDPVVGSFQVEDVRLKESTLTADGPEYRTVTRFGV